MEAIIAPAARRFAHNFSALERLSEAAAAGDAAAGDGSTLGAMGRSGPKGPSSLGTERPRWPIGGRLVGSSEVARERYALLLT